MHAAFQTVTFETADFAIHEQRVKRFSGIPTGRWGRGGGEGEGIEEEKNTG